VSSREIEKSRIRRYAKRLIVKSVKLQEHIEKSKVLICATFDITLFNQHRDGSSKQLD
jgi:hypothetical protein